MVESYSVFSPRNPKVPVTPRFVTSNLLVSRALFRKLSRVIYCFHGHKKKDLFIFVIFWNFWGHFLSRALFFEKSYGQFTDITGTFSKNIRGISKKITKKKNTETPHTRKTFYKLTWRGIKKKFLCKINLTGDNKWFLEMSLSKYIRFPIAIFHLN